MLAGIALLVVLGRSSLQASREPSLRGVVVGIEGQGFERTAAFVLRTPDGRETRFLVDPSVDPKWDPSHMRDHMMFAQPITVYYRRAGDLLAAHRITD